MGWPGSVQDTKVFRSSALFVERERHFNWDEYILCDRGYPLTKFTIRPFAEYDLTNDPVESRARKLWNQDLSHIRIAIEHAFGLLKGRFPILRNFPGHDLLNIYRTIQACMVLHNILIDLDDDTDDMDDFDGNDTGTGANDVREDFARDDDDPGPAEDNLDDMDDTTLYRTGLYRWKELLKFSYQI